MTKKRKSTQKTQQYNLRNATLLLLALALVYVIINIFIDSKPKGNDRPTENSNQSSIEEIYRPVETSKQPDSISSVLPEEHPGLEFPSKQEPWVAIIIDDFGPPVADEITTGFIKLANDITLSVIPGNPKTESVGVSARNNNREVFIHLPMQPIKAVALKERDMVFVGSSRDTISAILDRACDELPMAVGLNNHMGSLATTNQDLMSLLASELHERKLIFVDSRTVSKSCALFNMRKYGIPALGRDVFLDYYTGDDQIRSQLKKLVGMARDRGWSVGIGHARQSTLEVLREELPVYAENGVRFVSAGTLVKAVNNKTRKK